jgi:hypothetical protein
VTCCRRWLLKRGERRNLLEDEPPRMVAGVRRRLRAFVNLLRGRPPSLPMRLNSSGGSFARALPPMLANSFTVRFFTSLL